MLKKRSNHTRYEYSSLGCIESVHEQHRLTHNYLPNGLVHPYQLDESISNFRGVWCPFSFLFYFEQIFLLANSEDPDPTPRSAASDLGLHCLPMCLQHCMGIVLEDHEQQ